MNILGLTKTFFRSGDDVVVKREQNIPDWYLKSLDEERDERKKRPDMDWALLCVVPVALADEWLAQGFNIYSNEATPEEIMSRLRKHEMDKLCVYT